jgi:ABC-2 type transport system permease protein
MGAIYILWLRQLKRYFRSKSRIIGSLGQPLLFLVAFGYGFGAVFQKAGEGSYMQFLAPGIIAMSILFTAIFFGIEIIWDRQFGFLKETLVAPVSRLRIMVGRTLGGATVSVVQGLIVLVISLLAGFRPTSIAMLPLAVIFMAALAIIFTALGTAIASLLQDMQGFQLIMNFMIMPLFFLWGALVPLEGLPGPLAFAISVNPVTYGVDGLRGTLTGVWQFGLFTDLAVLWSVAALFLVIGGRLFSRIQI